MHRAAATKVSSLSITFQTLQPSEFVIFVVTGYREFVCYSEFTWQIISGFPVIRPGLMPSAEIASYKPT
jgi:hypothetical protein